MAIFLVQIASLGKEASLNDVLDHEKHTGRNLLLEARVGHAFVQVEFDQAADGVEVLREQVLLLDVEVKVDNETAERTHKLFDILLYRPDRILRLLVADMFVKAVDDCLSKALFLLHSEGILVFLLVSEIVVDKVLHKNLVDSELLPVDLILEL